jgi:hypothetical protein
MSLQSTNFALSVRQICHDRIHTQPHVFPAFNVATGGSPLEASDSRLRSTCQKHHTVLDPHSAGSRRCLLGSLRTVNDEHEPKSQSGAHDLLEGEGQSCNGSSGEHDALQRVGKDELTARRGMLCERRRQYVACRDKAL